MCKLRKENRRLLNQQQENNQHLNWSHKTYFSKGVWTLGAVEVPPSWEVHQKQNNHISWSVIDCVCMSPLHSGPTYQLVLGHGSRFSQHNNCHESQIARILHLHKDRQVRVLSIGWRANSIFSILSHSCPHETGQPTSRAVLSASLNARSYLWCKWDPNLKNQWT